MPLREHLSELRSRLVKSLAAIAIGMVVAWFYYDEIFAAVRSPFDDVMAQAEADGRDMTLAFTGVADPFVMQLKVTGVAGILLAVPGILTSAAGLLMLLPPVRAAMAERLARSMERSMQTSARITVITADDNGVRTEEWSAGRGADQPPRGGEVIQGEILPPPPRDDN